MLTKLDLQTIAQCYRLVKFKTSSKMEGNISGNRSIKVYSMGESNPVIRIDIKQKLRSDPVGQATND